MSNRVISVRMGVLPIVLLLLLAPISAAQSVLYKVKPITSPFDPADPISANGMNRWGAVAAVDRLSGHPRRGFIWRRGVGTPVPTFGGTCSSATDISDPGHIVGSACLAGDLTFHAFLYRNHHLIDLHSFGDISSSAGHVNRHDQVAGGFLQDGIIHSFFWEKKKAVDVGSLGGSATYGLSLSETGIITGQSDISNDLDPIFGVPRFHAFTWSGGVMTDLGSIFGGNFSYGNGVNAAGQIVGGADLVDDAGGHAFLLQNGVAFDLSPYGSGISSWGIDINEHGDIVGSWGFTDTDSADGPPLNSLLCPCYAVLWHEGQPVFLNSVVDPQWTLELGLRINDKGEIIARGQFNGGALQTVLLKPVVGALSHSRKSIIATRERANSPNSPRAFRREHDGKIEAIQ